MNGPLSVSATVSASLPPAPSYDVTMTVVLPRHYHVWVDPKSLVQPPDLDYERATVESLTALYVVAERTHQEWRRIFEPINREWRAPTADEERRLNELKREYDVAEAIFQRTLRTGADQ